MKNGCQCLKVKTRGIYVFNFDTYKSEALNFPYTPLDSGVPCMKTGSGSLQGTPEAVGLLGLETVIAGVEIAGYLGPDCSLID